ncbi:MAG: DUF438 domain-containing protein [Firmicutes bacterium]|nr:DUF438 domain-containing protein [Bacillota bacterium]
MTELINNRAYRQEQLKRIIRDLHAGQSVEDVKDRFRALIEDIGGTEISQLEQALIDEGIPEAEIKRLCDVHVSVFQEALDVQPPSESVPGHPIHTFRLENEALEKVIRDLQEVLNRLESSREANQELLNRWQELHTKLSEVEKHYSRKENILFPFLERNGITGPPGVMWSIHDDIRAGLKKTSVLLQQIEVGTLSGDELIKQSEAQVRPVLKAMQDMIYKEEKILFPMCLETLSEGEWQAVAEESDEIGYTLITPSHQWQPTRSRKIETTPTQIPEGHLQLSTGILTLPEIELIFNHLPVDITFVDGDNVVRYFSQGSERIFARTKAIIGRRVENCHPPESVHVVTEIIDDFRAGTRDVADFWIRLKGQLIYIRYFAVRDNAGEYIGVLEVTQNVTPIQELKGEKRLLDDA